MLHPSKCWKKQQQKALFTLEEFIYFFDTRQEKKFNPPEPKRKRTEPVSFTIDAHINLTITTNHISHTLKQSDQLARYRFIRVN